jgi:hypothetical protein
VTGAEVRRRVLEAISCGELPRGGPSELAAYDLIDEVPPGYLERWTSEVAERIREMSR